MKEPGTHKLTEALEGQAPPADQGNQHGPAEPQGPGTNPHEVAEEARRQQEAGSEVPPGRDETLTKIGRAQQTHG